MKIIFEKECHDNGSYTIYIIWKDVENWGNRIRYTSKLSFCYSLLSSEEYKKRQKHYQQKFEELLKKHGESKIKNALCQIYDNSGCEKEPEIGDKYYKWHGAPISDFRKNEVMKNKMGALYVHWEGYSYVRYRRNADILPEGFFKIIEKYLK